MRNRRNRRDMINIGNVIDVKNIRNTINTNIANIRNAINTNIANTRNTINTNIANTINTININIANTINTTNTNIANIINNINQRYSFGNIAITTVRIIATTALFSIIAAVLLGVCILLSPIYNRFAITRLVLAITGRIICFAVAGMVFFTAFLKLQSFFKASTRIIGGFCGEVFYLIARYGIFEAFFPTSQHLAELSKSYRISLGSMLFNTAFSAVYMLFYSKFPNNYLSTGVALGYLSFMYIANYSPAVKKNLQKIDVMQSRKYCIIKDTTGEIHRKFIDFFETQVGRAAGCGALAFYVHSSYSHVAIHRKYSLISCIIGSIFMGYMTTLSEANSMARKSPISPVRMCMRVWNILWDPLTPPAAAAPVAGAAAAAPAHPPPATGAAAAPAHPPPAAPVARAAAAAPAHGAKKNLSATSALALGVLLTANQILVGHYLFCAAAQINYLGHSIAFLINYTSFGYAKNWLIEKLPSTAVAA